MCPWRGSAWVRLGAGERPRRQSMNGPWSPILLGGHASRAPEERRAPRRSSLRRELGSRQQEKESTVELNEAGRRIFGQHWLLILSLTALGALAAASMHLGDQAQYTASARMVLGTDDPKTSSESAAISDTAWALATAPSSIDAALAASRVKADDPQHLADRVSVSAVGASGVLELSVTDGNPRTASALANALAREVSATRSNAIDREQAKLLTQIDGRIASLDRQITRLEAGPLGARAQ